MSMLCVLPCPRGSMETEYLTHSLMNRLSRVLMAPKKSQEKINEIAYQGKVLATKPADPSSILVLK